MSFWTTEKLRREQKKQPLIHPYDAQFVKQGAYELSLGPEAFVTTEPRGTKQKLEPREQLVIPPGQFGLLLTEEIVTIPSTAIGFISVRFTLKRRGLVNVSGFHVDPGFVGRLKFAVYNAGSQKIVVARGDRMFMIWYSDLSEPTTDLYKGQLSNQNEITSEDVMFLQGEVASPAELKQRLDALGSEVGNWKKMTIAVLTGLILLSLKSCFERPPAPSIPPIQSTSQREPVRDVPQDGSVVTRKTNNSSDIPNNPVSTSEPSK
jgi:dCTP deaminase